MESKLLKNLVLAALVSFSSGIFAKVVTPATMDELMNLYQKHVLIALLSTEPLENYKPFVEAAEKHPEYTFCFIDAHSLSLEDTLHGTFDYHFSYKGIDIMGGSYIEDRAGLEQAIEVFKDAVTKRIHFEKDMAKLSPRMLRAKRREMFKKGAETFNKLLALPGSSLFSRVQTEWDEKGNEVNTVYEIPYSDDLNIQLHLYLESSVDIAYLVDLLKTTEKDTAAYKNAFDLYKAYLRGTKSVLDTYTSSGDKRVDSFVEYSLNFINLALDADSY